MKLRILVQKRCAEPLGRRRDERVREGKFVRSLQPRRRAAQRVIRVMPRHRLRADEGQQFRRLPRVPFLGADVFQFREGDEGAVDLCHSQPCVREDGFHFRRARLRFVQCEPRGRVEDEDLSHAPAPWCVLPAGE